MTNVSTDNKHKGNENFPVGSFLIRPDLRRHVHAFYNFARAADNISDAPMMAPAEKIRLLDNFAKSLLEPQSTEVPEAATMRQSLIETNITTTHCLDLIRAFKQDAVKLRYRDWADLLDYCRYSASPVGRYVLALHGIGESAWEANDALCSALQIINHIQDCSDDYRELDRVYIPNDLFVTQKSNAAMISHAESTPELRATLQAMLDLLDPLMVTARKLPSHVPDLRLKLETAIIASLANNIIALLRKRDPLCDNVKLGKASMVRAVLGGVMRAWS